MNKLPYLALSIFLSLTAGAASAVTVVNGSFEDTSGHTPTVDSGSWKVFNTIPGWTTIDGRGIEIQTNPTLRSIDAQDGFSYVELDSHPRGGSNSTMRQTVDLGTGVYRLSFFYSPRTTNPDTNGIAYSLTNAGTGTALVSGAAAGPNATFARGVWTEIVSEFTVATAGLFHLDFAATGREDSYGGLIDNVAISAVPLPAGALLMLTGLGGLAITRRRKTAKQRG